MMDAADLRDEQAKRTPGLPLGYIVRLPGCAAMRCGAPDLDCTQRRLAGDVPQIGCYVDWRFLRSLAGKTP